MSTMPNANRMTESEYLRQPECSIKTEFLYGEVVRSPSPRWCHQELAFRLCAALRDAAPPEFTVGLAPQDIRFGPDRILQPDLYVLSERVSFSHTGPIEAVPVLVAEILSSRPGYDRVAKRSIYASAGVREYWVIDPDGDVERWTGDDLETREDVRDVLRTPEVPDFAMNVRELFRSD